MHRFVRKGHEFLSSLFLQVQSDLSDAPIKAMINYITATGWFVMDYNLSTHTERRDSFG